MWEGRGRRGQVHRWIPDESRATIVDCVFNHGLTMADAGPRVQPNVGRTTENSIIQTLCREDRCVYWTVTVYVVCSVPICTAMLFTVVHISTQRVFLMFVVHKYFSFARCCEQIRIAKSICGKNVIHTYSVSCAQLPQIQ